MTQNTSTRVLQTMDMSRARTMLARQLTYIKKQRSALKERQLMAGLYRHVTTVHAASPTLGDSVYVEYALTNHGTRPITVRVESSEPKFT